MVNIIRLHGDPHAQTQQLLPWYVNGALKGKELAEVEAHLAECAECCEDVEVEAALAHQMATRPRDVDRGWTVLQARIDEPLVRGRKVAFFGRRISLGWALAAQAASVALLVPIITLMLARPQSLYRALGSASGAAPGNLIVIFKPDSLEVTLRTILRQNQARIVDGPTSADAYVLHVPADQRSAVLARLKSDRNISLAEPIDGDAR